MTSDTGLSTRQAWFTGIYLVVCFVLFVGSMVFRDDTFMWLDSWLAPLPLSVSVLVGWLPVAIIVLAGILSATRSAVRRSRWPAVVAAIFALVLVVQTGMVAPIGPDGDLPTATGSAMQSGFLGAVGPLLIWTFLLMLASWLRDRVAGEKVPFGSPRRMDARYLIGGGAVGMLIGLAAAITFQG